MKNIEVHIYSVLELLRPEDHYPLASRMCLVLCSRYLTLISGLSALAGHAVQSGPARDSVTSHRALHRLSLAALQSGEAGVSGRSGRSGRSQWPRKAVVSGLTRNDQSGRAALSGRSGRTGRPGHAAEAGLAISADQSGVAPSARVADVALSAGGALQGERDGRVVPALGSGVSLRSGQAGLAGLAEQTVPARLAVAAAEARRALAALLAVLAGRSGPALLAPAAVVAALAALAFEPEPPAGSGPPVQTGQAGRTLVTALTAGSRPTRRSVNQQTPHSVTFGPPPPPDCFSFRWYTLGP